MNVSRLLKNLVLPLILFLIVLRHYLEVKTRAPNEYDILLPAVVLAVAAASLLAVVWREYRLWRQKKAEEQRQDEYRITHRQVFMFLLVVAYVIALKYAGFIVSTVLFLAAALYFVNFRNWKILVLLPPGFTLAIYYSFVHLLQLKLPAGTLWTLL